MEEAIHELESVPSSSIRSFAKQYGFDESTLRFRLKRRDANLASKMRSKVSFQNSFVISSFKYFNCKSNFLVFFLNVFGKLKTCKYIYVSGGMNLCIYNDI